MKKIFAYVGSPNGSESFTRQVTQKLMDEIVSAGKGQIQYEIYTPDQVSIEFCQGCKQCFEYGNCPYDECDSMKDIKKYILQSHLFVLASPVYAHNVTGQMKVFLDRLTYWVHLFRLIGKIGITLTTSDSNGNEYVNGYLSKIMEFLGVDVIANLKAYSTGLGEEQMEEGIQVVSKQVCEYLLAEKALSGTSIQEALFQNLKKHINDLGKNDIITAEYIYWKEHRYLEAENYAGLLKRKIIEK